MTPQEKIKILFDESKVVLRVIRDLKSNAKSTKKNKLTKIEKHASLMVEMYEDLCKAYEKENK